jgi:hypothetical protein
MAWGFRLLDCGDIQERIGGMVSLYYLIKKEEPRTIPLFDP